MGVVTLPLKLPFEYIFWPLLTVITSVDDATDHIPVSPKGFSLAPEFNLLNTDETLIGSRNVSDVAQSAGLALALLLSL